MNIGRKSVVAALMTAAMALGALVGVAAFGGTPSTANAASLGTVANLRGAGPTGSFKPNEDPAHEAGESKEREAQEDAGQVPTVP